MTRRSFHFESTGANLSAVVKVGDHDLSNATRGVYMRADVGEITKVELDLAIIETQQVDVADADVIVSLRPGVHEALIALGWTPPVDA